MCGSSLSIILLFSLPFLRRYPSALIGLSAAPHRDRLAVTHTITSGMSVLINPRVKELPPSTQLGSILQAVGSVKVSSRNQQLLFSHGLAERPDPGSVSFNCLFR